MNNDRSTVNEQVYHALIQRGWLVGRAKSGNILRVDSRSCPNAVNAETVTCICRLTTLRELYLRDFANINDFADQLAGLTKLKVLDLEATDLSDESLRKLTALNQLEMINVRQTQVNASLVAELRKKMIGTRIIGP